MSIFKTELRTIEKHVVSKENEQLWKTTYENVYNHLIKNISINVIN